MKKFNLGEVVEEINRSQESWLDHYYALANLVATRSKDPSKKVGAVIIDEYRRVVSTGFNGFPRGVNDDPLRYSLKATKYKLIVHSEANAILSAAVPVIGFTIVTTKFPCSDCTKLIIQSGIKRVFSPPPTTSSPWAEDAEWSLLMMKEAGIYLKEKTP